MPFITNLTEYFSLFNLQYSCLVFARIDGLRPICDRCHYDGGVMRRKVRLIAAAASSAATARGREMVFVGRRGKLVL